MISQKSNCNLQEKRKITDIIIAAAVILIVFYNINVIPLDYLEKGNARLFGVWRGIPFKEIGTTLLIFAVGAKMSDLLSGGLSLKDYYKTAWLSIFPMYLVSYLVSYFWMKVPNGGLGTAAPHYYLILTFLGMDGYLINGVSNFYLTGEWFVGLFVILFLMLPFLVKGIQKFPIVMAVAVAAVFVLSSYWYPAGGVLSNAQLPWVRSLEFCAGIYFAMYYRKWNWKIMVPAGIAALILLGAGSIETGRVPGIFRIECFSWGVILTLCIFGSLMRGKRNPVSIIARWMSRNAYAILLVDLSVLRCITADMSGALNSAQYWQILLQEIPYTLAGAWMLTAINDYLTEFLCKKVFHVRNFLDDRSETEQEKGNSVSVGKTAGTAGIAKKRKRNFSMDFIRAIGVLMIVFYHMNIEFCDNLVTDAFAPIHRNINVSYGQVGVFLFVLLSGSALAINYQGKYDRKTYYKKRLLSLFPMFYVAYSVCFVWIRVVRGGLDPNIPVWRLIFTLVGVDGYLKDIAPDFYLLGEWFLGLIVVLYLIYPLLNALIERFPKQMLVGIAVWFVVVTAFYPFASFNYPERDIIVRVVDFALGIYLVRYVKKIPWFLAAAGVVVIAVITAVKLPILEIYSIELYGISLYFVLRFLGELIEGHAGWLEKLCRLVCKFSYPIFLAHHVIIQQVLFPYTGTVGSPQRYLLCVVEVILFLIPATIFLSWIDRAIQKHFK